MTKPKGPPNSAEMLEDLIEIICGESNNAMKAKAIKLAFEIGECEGRVQGSKRMLDEFKTAHTLIDR